MAALWMGPIARGTLISILIRVTALGVGFVQAVLTARLLGAEGYGVIAVALSVAMVGATLATLGLGSLAVREVAELVARADPSRLHGFLRFSAGSVLGASVLAGVGIVVLARWTEVFSEPFRDSAMLAAILVPPLALLRQLRGAAQGLGRVVAAQAPGEVLRPLVMVGLLGIVAMTGTSLGTSAYIGLAAAAALVATLAGAFALWRAIDASVRVAAPRTEPRAWSRAALPFLGISAIAMLQGEINTLLLGWLAGPREAGLFQPLARLAPLMTIGMQAVAMRYAPRVAELWTRGEIASLLRITRLVTLTTTVATAVTCGVILVAAPWLLSVFGEAFTVSFPALWWIAAAQVFNAACGPVGLLLTMTGRPGRAFGGHVAALATNAGLGMWLIPGLGAHGAAQAMAGGIVVWNLVMLLSVRRVLRFDPSLAGALSLSRPRGN